MKKILTILIILAGGLIFMSFTVPQPKGTSENSTKGNIVIPHQIHAIIMAHCYMCHNSKSRGVKSKAKLNYDLLTHMPLPTLVGKLQGIHDALSKGKMPPKKFLEHHPDKALSAEQKSVFENWAAKSADSLMKYK